MKKRGTKASRLIFNNGRHGFLMLKSSLFGFGRNSYGQLGLKKKSEFEEFAENDFFRKQGIRVKNISIGLCHTVFQTSKGLFGVGYNYYNQLCIHKETSFSGCMHILKIINKSVGNEVREVFCTQYNTYFCRTDGMVFGCGENGFGHLGCGFNASNRKEGMVRAPFKIILPNDKDLETIMGGEYFTLFHFKDGDVYCSDSRARIPALLSGGIVQISCSPSDFCFLIDQKRDVFLKIMTHPFYNSDGGPHALSNRLIGSGKRWLDAVISRVPKNGNFRAYIPSKSTPREVLCGWNHVCILMQNGQVFSFGSMGIEVGFNCLGREIGSEPLGDGVDYEADLDRWDHVPAPIELQRKVVVGFSGHQSSIFVSTKNEVWVCGELARRIVEARESKSKEEATNSRVIEEKVVDVSKNDMLFIITDVVEKADGVDARSMRKLSKELKLEKEKQAEAEAEENMDNIDEREARLMFLLNGGSLLRRPLLFAYRENMMYQGLYL